MKKIKLILAITVTLFSIFVILKAAASNNTVKRIVLTSKNTIALRDQINSETTADIMDQARSLDKSFIMSKIFNDPIYLVLRTPGGDVQSGLEMIESLHGLNRRIDTITVFSASMGFQTVQQLGTRYILTNGILMSHRAKGTFGGEFGGLKPAQIDSYKNFWERRIDELDAMTVYRTHGLQTLESYRQAYAPEMWLTGSQSVDQGYADQLVTISCDSSLSGSTVHETAGPFDTTISYELDDCPISSTPRNIKISGFLTNKGYMSVDEFKSKNGGYGAACLLAANTNANLVCASDTAVSSEDLNKIKLDFMRKFVNIKDNVIPLEIH